MLMMKALRGLSLGRESPFVNQPCGGTLKFSWPLDLYMPAGCPDCDSLLEFHITLHIVPYFFCDHSAKSFYT